MWGLIVNRSRDFTRQARRGSGTGRAGVPGRPVRPATPLRVPCTLRFASLRFATPPP